MDVIPLIVNLCSLNINVIQKSFWNFNKAFEKINGAIQN